jgi:hypothetical protein
MGEGYVAIQRGGGLPVVGDGGSLMTHSAGLALLPINVLHSNMLWLLNHTGTPDLLF